MSSQIVARRLETVTARVRAGQDARAQHLINRAMHTPTAVSEKLKREIFLLSVEGDLPDTAIQKMVAHEKNPVKAEAEPEENAFFGQTMTDEAHTYDFPAPAVETEQAPAAPATEPMQDDGFEFYPDHNAKYAVQLAVSTKPMRPISPEAPKDLDNSLLIPFVEVRRKILRPVEANVYGIGYKMQTGKLSIAV